MRIIRQINNIEMCPHCRIMLQYNKLDIINCPTMDYIKCPKCGDSIVIKIK